MVTDLIEKLKDNLKKPLPGFQAQYKMAAYRKLVYDFPDINSLNPKNGCVLILLYPKDEKLTTVYIKRTEYKGVHGGQISFPGGKFEASDITFENTALRETREEIGIRESNIEIIGQLTELYIPPSNFLVYPFVGFSSKAPEFDPDKREVEKVIEVNVNTILKASENISEKKIKTSNDIIITAPYFDILGHHIWGATAMITSEFVEICR